LNGIIAPVLHRRRCAFWQTSEIICRLPACGGGVGDAARGVLLPEEFEDEDWADSDPCLLQASSLLLEESLALKVLPVLLGLGLPVVRVLNQSARKEC